MFVNFSSEEVRDIVKIHAIKKGIVRQDEIEEIVFDWDRIIEEVTGITIALKTDG